MIHVTDPHLTSLAGLSLKSLRGKRWSGYLSWHRRRRFVHLAEVLERLTEAVREEDPVQILVTGDLVHVGLPGEIEAAACWLEALGPPERVMLVPGNHDVYARDSWPAVARSWQPYLGELHPGSDSPFPLRRDIVARDGRVCLVGLSSAVPSPLFMAYGRLGDAQCRRLDTLLADADGFRCVLVHHPPLPAMTRWRKGLLDAARLGDVLDRRGAEMILHGHVHRNVSRTGPGGIHIYGTASASSGSGACLAAYRSFDVERLDEGWQVDMRLVVCRPDGSFEIAARERWYAALRSPARKSSDAR